MEGFGHSFERTDAQDLFPLNAPEVQFALAHAAFNASTDAAVESWVGDPDDPDSLAARFREYVKAHPDEKLNLKDPKALHEFLELIQRGMTH